MRVFRIGQKGNVQDCVLNNDEETPLLTLNTIICLKLLIISIETMYCNIHTLVSKSVVVSCTLTARNKSFMKSP